MNESGGEVFFANVKQTASCLMINSPGHVITSLQSFWHVVASFFELCWIRLPENRLGEEASAQNKFLVAGATPFVYYS